MNKYEYILRSISKIKHKEWELFVISRIVHRILDLDIEFVCQQLVRRSGGNRSLTDLYFPQFRIHLEVDEPPHETELAKKIDAIRSNDIIDSTGHIIERIKAIQDVDRSKISLSHVVKETDKFIDMILMERSKQLVSKAFEPWDFESRYDPQRYIDKKKLDTADGCAFRTHRDALRCFGYTKGHLQAAAWQLPDGTNRRVWFPKFYENDGWDNSICPHGKTITQKSKLGKADSTKEGREAGRIVFAHYTDTLGKTLYRFLGFFEFDEKASIDPLTTVFQLRSNVVNL